MKQLYILLTFAAILFTGCMDVTNSPDCVPVDQTSYLEDYANTEGYEVTDSGLIYKIIEMGDVEVPPEEQYVFITFNVELVIDHEIETPDDLTLIDRFNVEPVGIREGLSMMDEGSTYELVMPPELAYGNDPPQNSIIQCGAVVIFEITLDSFLRDANTFLEQNAAHDDIEQTESGLQYRIIEEGEGDNPTSESTVRVFYKGKLTNDYVFDESQGSNTARFNIPEMIPGFAEGLQLMNKGSKYQFFIPPNLAYGNDPRRDQFGTVVIPPNSILVFEVELVEIL